MKMTNEEIKTFSLDGFKDGFEAATNRLAEKMKGKRKEEFLQDMADIQKYELEKAAKIWDMTFLEVAKSKNITA